jgi:hypothetical protein
MLDCENSTSLSMGPLSRNSLATLRSIATIPSLLFDVGSPLPAAAYHSSVARPAPTWYNSFVETVQVTVAGYALFPASHVLLPTACNRVASAAVLLPASLKGLNTAATNAEAPSCN